MQLELPPLSQFLPSVWLLFTLGFVAAWGWSVWLLATGRSGVRLLPVWFWAVLLVIAPIVSVPLFLVFGASLSSSPSRRAAAIGAIAALVATVAVVAIQQIGIWDCRVASEDPLTRVCEMEPRSILLPVAFGILSAIAVGILVMRRQRPTPPPQPLAI